jgi:N-acetylmuramoyl-L-alanine amidase
VLDLASRIEGRLAAAGATVYLTRGRDQDPTPAERTAFANDARADLFLSLHTDAHSSEHARGVASYYYGTGSGASSTSGALRRPRPPEVVAAPACSTRLDAKVGTCSGVRMPAVRLGLRVPVPFRGPVAAARRPPARARSRTPSSPPFQRLYLRRSRRTHHGHHRAAVRV